MEVNLATRMAIIERVI